ncbi:Protein of unknown function [Sanguibacter gelidistatuariae]|uniref:DUF4233 domain-containing protein n=1 Tax=Sanguibacter gelidistatuariae TaxID=1814289 RepID=A0A1G6NH39_9MICO|nr:Protein of unknown function [Sanguibacter gelidistatuariae]
MPAQSGPLRDPSDASPATPRIVRKKAAKPQFTSTMLILEAFVVFFATLVADKLVDAPSSKVWLAGGVLAVVLIVLSRMVGTPGGYVAGSVVQIPLLATGFVVPLMFPVAIVFVALWVVSLRLGAKIDRERAAYDAAHPDKAPNVT